MNTTQPTYQPQQIVVTQYGLAVIEQVEAESKSVRVKHINADTPITDFTFDDIRPADKKETLEAHRQLIQNKIACLNKAKKEEQEKLMNEKHAPLQKQADEMKSQIKSDIHKKYNADEVLLAMKQQEIQETIDNLIVQEMQTVWHPHGTIVTLYESKGYSYHSPILKTNTTGTVQVYDGTQPTPANMHSYSLPKKGDVCVFFNKKDGTMGTRFVIILSKWNKDKKEFSHFANKWLIEGETPEDNLATRIQKEIKEKAV